MVFDANSPYKGKITAYDDPIYIADAALYLKSTRPDLHITDPYELDSAQFNAAVALLKVQHTVIGTYWSDYTKEQSAFANADSVVGTTWQVIANLLLTDKTPTPVAVTVPKEGSTGWSDTWMMYSHAAHPNCMYLWMNWITTPNVQSQVAQWFGEAPANLKACDIIAKTDADVLHDLSRRRRHLPARPGSVEGTAHQLRRQPGQRLHGIRRMAARLDRHQGIDRSIPC